MVVTSRVHYGPQYDKRQLCFTVISSLCFCCLVLSELKVGYIKCFNPHKLVLWSLKLKAIWY